MAERFLVWGGGGHGKVLADLIRALGHQVCGFVDADPAKHDALVEPGGGRVLVAQDHLLRCAGAGGYPLEATAVALAIGDNRARSRCLAGLGPLRAPPLVHPSAAVSPSAAVGRGSVVFPGAVLNAAAVLGDAVIVNSRAVVEHDCMVGDGAHVSPGAVLCGDVRVGPRSWVGAGSILIPGVRIGADVVVGAGAVVIRDVPDGSTVIGNPATAISPTRQEP
jgi:sugar O-acyltransferase (sialic acid O-acetyltransferase NeuD family)